ncbi:hypothetical protein DIPPA_20860 [Diplonema papillatum]|nr:hypothetical protein DIPPA_20860 [Diplonema papillatum]
MTYTGSVVLWNSKRGYGYIACDQVEGDVFVHASAFGGGELICGQQVTFRLDQSEAGKVRAIDVVFDAPPGGVHEDAGLPVEPGFQGAKGKGTRGKGKGGKKGGGAQPEAEDGSISFRGSSRGKGGKSPSHHPQVHTPAPEHDNQAESTLQSTPRQTMYSGVVARWNSRKGCGFISCSDFAEDLFVHVSSFGGGELIEGAAVNFDVEDESNGKKKAIMVTGEGVDPSRRPPPRDEGRDGGGYGTYDTRREPTRFGGGRGGGKGGGGQTYSGTVARWNSMKGLGYISCRDFDQDVFVHVTAFGGGELVEGQNVTFEIGDDGNGKTRAQHVRGPAVVPRRGGGDDQYTSRDSRDRRSDYQQSSFGGPRNDRYNGRRA